MDDQTEKLKWGYKNPTLQKELLTCRTMNFDELKALKPGKIVPVRCHDGLVRNVKINGAPKFWKRTPNRCKIPVKYGLYEYGYIEFNESYSYGGGFAVPLVILTKC